jgi:hypothetical protein
MIFDLRFGYTARPHIYYDTQHRRGTLKLWASYSGSFIGVDLINIVKVSHPNGSPIEKPGIRERHSFGQTSIPEFSRVPHTHGINWLKHGGVRSRF